MASCITIPRTGRQGGSGGGGDAGGWEGGSVLVNPCTRSTGICHAHDPSVRGLLDRLLLVLLHHSLGQTQSVQKALDHPRLAPVLLVAHVELLLEVLAGGGAQLLACKHLPIEWDTSGIECGR